MVVRTADSHSDSEVTSVSRARAVPDSAWGGGLVKAGRGGDGERRGMYLDHVDCCLCVLETQVDADDACPGFGEEDGGGAAVAYACAC